MSLIEEIGELSLACASLKAENEELREVIKDATELLERFHAAIESMDGLAFAVRAPIMPMIEAWQTRASALLNDTKSQ